MQKRRNLHYAPVSADKCCSKTKMASFLGRDSTRFSSRSIVKDRLLGPHSILSDGLLIAFLWASLLVSSDLVSGKTTAIRRVQNVDPRGYSLWSPSKVAPDFDYLVESQPEEDDDEEDNPRRGHRYPPVPPRLNRQPPLYHDRRPGPTFDPDERRRPPSPRPTQFAETPSGDPNSRLSPPRAVSFGGQFHISSDQFVPFEPHDARVSQTLGHDDDQTTHPNPSFRPPTQTAPFVTPIDNFTPTNGLKPAQHMAVARPDKVREIVRFTEPESTTPVDDSALYYRPPATTTTSKSPYVVVPEDAIKVSLTNLSKPDNRHQEEEGAEGDEEKGEGSLGDEPADVPTYLSRPGSDSGAVHHKRWRDGAVSTYLKPTVPSSRTNPDLTEVYYPSEFTSQSPYWTERNRHFTTSSSLRPNSRIPPTIRLGHSHNPTDSFVPVRIVNWSTESAPADDDDEDGGEEEEAPPSPPHEKETPFTRFTTVATTVSQKEISSSAKPVSDKEKDPRPLSTGAIAGIAIGILAPLALVAGAMAYLLYGRHFKNVSHKSDGRAITERGSYIDDSVRPSGYMNSHIELPKESSEEMTSLDNDSFLNSLEAVTIQNYWAESAKNTKV